MTTRPQVLIDATSITDSPVAVVDEAARDRNIRRMQNLADTHGLRLRPHAKSHKSSAVGLKQVAAGAVGLTVATLQEATIFLDAGVDDLVWAHVPVGAEKLKRLGVIAEKARRFAVAVDSVGVARTLPVTVDVYWEVDTGLHRLGTPPGSATVESVRQLLDVIGPARFRGLITHGGVGYTASNAAELRAAAEGETNGLTETAAMLASVGVEVRELSVGSTPTSAYWDQVRGATEIRPGTYIYGDANQVQLGAHPVDDCAFLVVATVISRPEARRIVLDAGSKALALDLRVPGVEACGLIAGRPDLRLDRLSEEHGVVVAEDPIDLQIGDRVAIIPNHVCTAVNLHPSVLVVDEAGMGRWEPVDARGWRPALS